MVTLDWTTSAHDGVTLVSVRLTDIDVPTRVRVESRLDGAVWPPRREGLPESGWTDKGFAGVVDPETAVLGYASPASPAEPPVELTEAEPVPEAEGRKALTADPESVVRELGDPAPPADAVPATASGDRAAPPEPTHSDTTTGDDTADTSASTGAPAADENEPTEPDGDAESADLPPAVGPWLAEMARRTDRAEHLHQAETLPEATAAVRAAGGLEGVRDLAAADDAAQLRALARRARRLADRRAETTVPVDTLATLA